MKKLFKIKRRGSAIPLAVCAVLILLAMGTGLLKMGLNNRIIATRTSSDITARCAADAGLTMALFAMNKKIQAGPWSDSFLPQVIDEKLPYCNASYSYTVAGDLNNGYMVKSVGRSALAQRAVSATLELRGIFEYAILTKEMLILKPDTLVDGYNSLDPSDTDNGVEISTQSTADSRLVLNTGVTVNGDVTVGVGGDPETVIKDLGATTGDQTSAIIKDPLPIINPPELFNMATNIVATGEALTLTPADSGQYNNIFIKKADDEIGKLKINGGDVVLYITGDIELGESCEITIKDGSSLTLYIDGDIHCRANSGINAEYPVKDSTNFQLYGTSETEQTFDLKAKFDWSGTIYAPNADITLFANGDFYGSTVSNNFELKSGGNYYYDEALRKVSIEDAGVRFVVDRWYEGNFKFINDFSIAQN